MASNPKQNNMEEIDLFKLLKALWRKAWLIVLCAIIGGGLAFGFAYMTQETKYESSALIYVNSNSLSLGSAKLSISSGDIRTTNSLMETYSVILTSRNTLQEIIAETGLPYSYEQLQKMITSEPVGETAIFKITVTADDPAVSAHIANSILAVLPDKISTVIEGASAQIVEEAVPGTPKTNRSIIKTAVLGSLVGVVLSASLVAFLFLIDTKIRNEDFLLETYKDIPVLATVPDLSSNGKGGYYYRRAYSRSKSSKYAYASANARRKASNSSSDVRVPATRKVDDTLVESDYFLRADGKKEE
ncbi:MAG: hypothetical protein J6U54_22135 [Clostridiales bacterium]|nr:hypothetical protein [Clostridiales bacterium]